MLNRLNKTSLKLSLYLSHFFSVKTFSPRNAWIVNSNAFMTVVCSMDIRASEKTAPPVCDSPHTRCNSPCNASQSLCCSLLTLTSWSKAETETTNSAQSRTNCQQVFVWGACLFVGLPCPKEDPVEHRLHEHDLLGIHPVASDPLYPPKAGHHQGHLLEA